ncbi:nicotinate phosphoribosyltransferase [Acidimicrobium ferrooxidans DSM 10331]|uniref:Nicotinate phosphoribosyltransferase n=1 Tax=Acidimicrobium ferrooxidans (strain DSM 10331 / JCM 15462 / NBRC 103882 / ICP) TaxID=525909 RepID=C7M0H3_ACIFD|nr:nicotinate phosphoribosyltransferase [Acidimicrobium ferrooxidans]ACU54481.1 nicotinate phosphoribosyltransferase [Acidimicrobium ferrooxidans DSM 10331]
MSSTALLTDRYELTMLETAIASGLAEVPATFEVFARSLGGRGFGVVGGTGRLAEALRAFRFDDEIVRWLVDERVIGSPTARYLEHFRFSGSIAAYPDGELYFPGSPILRVDAPFGEGLLIETLILSILNFDTAVATAAARLRLAAGTATLIEMGSRRVHERAAVAAARAAWIAGFDSTSNLAAGQRYGVPTGGTMGHALVLAHPSERAAFEAQAAVIGSSTTALVDTYDIGHGIRQAIEAFGTDLAAIRIDSGNPFVEVRRARTLLDELGATKTRILISGDLDEGLVRRLVAEPVDGFGVGTKVVTGGGVPTAQLVYKLVAVERNGVAEPVAKLSANKETSGGRKAGYRRLRNHRIVEEFSIDPAVTVEPTDDSTLMALEVPVMVEGDILDPESAAQSRQRLADRLPTLGEDLDAILDATEPLFVCHHLGPSLPRSGHGQHDQ